MSELWKVFFIYLFSYPITLLGLRLIFKKSVMFRVSHVSVLLIFISAFLTYLISQIGLIHMAWVLPLIFLMAILSFLSIRKKLTLPLNNSIKALSNLSEGELDVDIKQSKSKSELGILNRAIIKLSENLKKIVSAILNNAETLSMSSQQMSVTSEELSKGASEQAASIEELSATIEEITGMLTTSMENAQKSGTITTDIQKTISSMADKTRQMLNVYNQIVEKITHVNDIALETNILALNAGVEAARAGEHGKGFSVVATEVKNLADQSKKLATAVLNESSTSIEMSEDVENRIAALLPRIDESTQLAQNIALSSKEQTIGVEQVNNTVQQLNQVTQQNAAASEEMAANAEELAAQAKSLNDAVSYFKMKDAATKQMRG